MVSPLGGDVGSTWTRLLDGQSGAKPITAFKADDLATKIAATVPRGASPVIAGESSTGGGTFVLPGIGSRAPAAR